MGPGASRFLHRLHGWSEGCAKLPMVAAVALVLSARVAPLIEAVRAEPAPPAASEAARPAPDPDAEVILGVLAKRAPELGLTLREQLGKAIAEEARAAGYDPLLILAIIDVESDFEEEAVSHKGARGLMQIKPSTLHFVAQKQGLRLTAEEIEADPAVQLRLGVRYLRELQDRFRGDLDLALMAYNAGPTRIRQALKARETDPFRRYARLVQRDFRRFREGEGLGGDWALAVRDVGRDLKDARQQSE